MVRFGFGNDLRGYDLPILRDWRFGGIRINTQGQAMDTEEIAIPGLYAAGENVGGLFWFNYPGGTGLMSGSVFGKRAGSGAAAYAKSNTRGA